MARITSDFGHFCGGQVRAVRMGYVLVIDEADKAPVEVVTILKSLIEDGEMLAVDETVMFC